MPLIIYSLDINSHHDFSKDVCLYSFVSAERLERINKLCFHVDKRVLLYSELLVKKIVAKHLILPVDNVVISKNIFGKPYVKGCNNFHFSVSHTRNSIVVVVGNSPLGVDVEQLNSFSDVSNVVDYFTVQEQKYIKEYDEDKKLAILKIWTQKEAYLKAIGIGLHKQLNSFSVLGDKRFITYFEDIKITSLFSFHELQIQKIIKVNLDFLEIYDYYCNLL